MFWRRLPYLKILNNFALPIFFFFLLSFYIIHEIKNGVKYLFIFCCLLFFQLSSQRIYYRIDSYVEENPQVDFNLFLTLYESSIREVYMPVKKRNKLTADLTEALLLRSVFGGAAAPRFRTHCTAGSPW